MAATITIVCPYCNNHMRASSEHVGRKGRCPSCKALVEIRAAGEESSVTLQPAGAAGGFRAAEPRSTSTEVPEWLAGLIGAAATIVLYIGLFIPLQDRYVGTILVKRGPVQYITMLVTCWGLSLLVMKYVALRKQKSYAELELELIPLEIGVQITPDNVDQFLEHLARLPRPQRSSILGCRLRGALEHFKSRTSVPEVQQYLATQSEIDSSAVDSGYTLLRSFIWVVPLLGFIGTVTGISDAVVGLDKSLANAGAQASTSDLLNGLGTVTQGLAVAFDTTFLGLVMAIVLLFPTEALRKTEYGMLDRIEAFANESLLRRMSDQRGAPSLEEMPDVVRGALDSAFREHQRWLAQWQAQVAQLGQLVGGEFEAAVIRVEDRISQTESARLQKFEGLTRLLDEVFGKAERASGAWQQSEQEARARSQEFFASVARLEGSLAEHAKLWEGVSQQQARLIEQYSRADLNGNMAGLAEQIGKLASRLDGSERPREESRYERAAAPEPAFERSHTLPANTAIPDGLNGSPGEVSVLQPVIQTQQVAPQRQSFLSRVFGRRP